MAFALYVVNPRGTEPRPLTQLACHCGPAKDAVQGASFVSDVQFSQLRGRENTVDTKTTNSRLAAAKG